MTAKSSFSAHVPAALVPQPQLEPAASWIHLGAATADGSQSVVVDLVAGVQLVAVDRIWRGRCSSICDGGHCRAKDQCELADSETLL